MFELRDKIRKASRNTALTYGCFALLLSACWFPFFGPWMGRAIHGPQQATAQTIDSFKASDEPLLTFEVKNPDHIATERSSKSSTINAQFYLVPAGDKQLLVCTGAGPAPSGPVTGVLTDSPSKLKGHIANPLGFVQGMLDTKYGRTTNWWGHLLIGLTWLILARAAVVGLLEWLNPTRHPQYKKVLAQGGEAGLTRLDSEMNQSMVKVGPLHLSENWLVRAGGVVLEVFPLSDLMWAYHKVTRTKAYGVVTTNTRYEILLNTRDGQTCTVGGKQKACEEMLDKLAQEVPWMVFGYSDERSKMWNSERAEFIALVDERRRQYEGQE